MDVDVYLVVVYLNTFYFIYMWKRWGVIILSYLINGMYLDVLLSVYNQSKWSINSYLIVYFIFLIFDCIYCYLIFICIICWLLFKSLIY